MRIFSHSDVEVARGQQTNSTSRNDCELFRLPTMKPKNGKLTLLDETRQIGTRYHRPKEQVLKLEKDRHFANRKALSCTINQVVWVVLSNGKSIARTGMIMLLWWTSWCCCFECWIACHRTVCSSLNLNSTAESSKSPFSEIRERKKNNNHRLSPSVFPSAV